MCRTLSFSAYVSSFEKQKDMLNKVKGSGAYIFSSFHTAEEINEDYITKSAEMCKWLKENDFKIIGDVSCRTPEIFGCKNVVEFSLEYGIDIARLDYGFTMEETIEIAKQIPIALNATTNNLEFFSKVKDQGVKVCAMHNFYPRPETGLDEDMLLKANHKLISIGIEPLAFIPCDLDKRGPIYEGLPTLESHRDIPPYCGFVDLAENYGVKNIFAGDNCMSENQLSLINDYILTGVISLPIIMDEKHSKEYGKTYTLRMDSPSCAFRLVESREFSHPGELIEPSNCKERLVGSITMDNCNYKRYSGEIMIIRKELPCDDRVNVIGHVQKEYARLLSSINNGNKVKFVSPI